MRRFWYCDRDTAKVTSFESFADTQHVPSAMGTKLARDFAGSAKARITIPGLDANGGVIYTARHGGTTGNNLRVSHATGLLGGNYANRPLAATIDGFNLVITYGTDGAGESVCPTAAAVAALVNGDSGIKDYIEATFEGTGAGLTSAAPSVPLVGGLDNGDWRKFPGSGGICRRVNTVEVI